MRPLNSANNNHSNSSKNSATNDDDGIQILDTAASGSSARRLRGRHAASKNKLKPTVVITRDSPTALQSNLLEIATGADVMDTVAALAKRRQHGFSILSGSGTVSNVSIRQPGGAIACFTGDFDIIFVQGVFLPPPSPPESSGMTAFFVGEQGKIVGGRVSGKLLASGTVTLIAASFASVTMERPLLGDEIALQQQQQNQEMNSGSEQSQECEDEADLDVDP